MGLHFATEENEGRIYVDLRGNRVDAPPTLPSQPQGYQGGQSGGGYQQQPQRPQRPQQQQQQQQQPEQQQQDDDLWGCLKACCSVM